MSQHPGRYSDRYAVGASAGAAVFVEDDSVPDDSFYLWYPYGEGWARFPVGPGQLEVRLLPALANVSYRFEVSGAESSIVLRLRAAAGVGGLFEFREAYEDEWAILLVPSIGAELVVNGVFYFAPQFGAGFYEGLNGSEPTLLSVGASAGYIREAEPFLLTFEVAFQRVVSPDDTGFDPQYLVVPTVGLQLSSN